MKNKIFSGVLISLVFPICGNAVTVTGDELNIGTGNTVLAGSKSGAVGENNTAASRAFAIGYNNDAVESSLVLGYNNVSLGSAVLVGGSNANADGGTLTSLIFGESLVASGVYSSAILGSNNRVNNLATTGSTGGSETGLLVAGIYNHVNRPGGTIGEGNIILGYGNAFQYIPADGSYMQGSVLIGIDNLATETESWVFGKGNRGQAGTVTLGTFASQVPAAALIVGTGSNDPILGTEDRANGFVVLKNGTVQIPGSLEIGGVSALTTTSAATAGYMKKAMGSGATAGANALAAWGDSASATGYGSLAMGSSVSASGESSIAMGYDSHASGISSIALGEGSSASGYNSATIGGGQASGNNAFSSNRSNAAGNWSVALGAAYAQGESSVAIGNYHEGSSTMANHSYGKSSATLGGIRNVANGLGSIASGTFIQANSAHSIALGSLNKGSSTSATAWVQTDPLFELGNGYTSTFSGAMPSPSLRSNAITTLKNGQTTLTNKFWVSTTPEVVPAAADASAGAALVVEGHTELKGNTVLDGKTRLKGTVVLDQAQGDISMGIYE